MAKRMNTFIAKYIGKDQSEFIGGKQMVDLARWILNIIYVTTKNKLKVWILPLDISKSLFVWNGQH